jgi:hypothetical protein
MDGTVLKKTPDANATGVFIVDSCPYTAAQLVTNGNHNNTLPAPIPFTSLR